MNKLTLLLLLLTFCTRSHAQIALLDPGFGNNGMVLLPNTGQNIIYPKTQSLLMDDGRLYVMAIYTENGGRSLYLFRFMPDGSLDATFGNQGKLLIGTNQMDEIIAPWNLTINAMPNGGVLVSYLRFEPVIDGAAHSTLVWLNVDGSPHTTFGNNGRVEIEESEGNSIDVIKKIFFHPNTDPGKPHFTLIYTGSIGFRLLSLSGSIIPGYEEVNTWEEYNYQVRYYDYIMQPDQKFLACGDIQPNNSSTYLNLDIHLARFEKDGYIDENYGVNGYSRITLPPPSGESLTHMELLPDQQHILAFGLAQNNTVNDILMMRFKSNGKLDSTYYTNGITRIPYQYFWQGNISPMSVDNQFIIVSNHINQGVLTRISLNGVIDSSFGLDGTVILTQNDNNFKSYLDKAFIRPDRRIVTVGTVERPDGSYSLLVAQFLPEGNATAWYQDNDQDGYGLTDNLFYAFSQPNGYSAVPGDCNDNTAAIAPNVTEICNNIDDDCDGLIDERPDIHCADNYTIGLNPLGLGSLEAEDLVLSTSNCLDNLSGLSLDNSLFTCNEIGSQTVTVTATGTFGDIITCQSQVQIIDALAPKALCLDDILVVLDDTGLATILPQDLDAGSYDNCGGVTLEATPTQFTSQQSGLHIVTLSVTDASGNTATCTVEVTVSGASSTDNPSIEASKWVLSPNPALESVVLSSTGDVPTGVCTIQVQDVYGRSMLPQSVVFQTEQEVTIPAANWPAGLYRVSVKQNGTIHSLNFVKL